MGSIPLLISSKTVVFLRFSVYDVWEGAATDFSEVTNEGIMKKKLTRLFLSGLLCAVLCTAFAGCGSTENSDQDFGDEEYDVEQLMNDYAPQLLHDGAETLTGSVELTGSDGNYLLLVHQKEVVVNENYEGGYYIADRNMTTEHDYGSDAGIVIDKGGVPDICSTEDFIEYYSGKDDSLYTVYLIDDTVELILPLDPHTVVASQTQ